MNERSGNSSLVLGVAALAALALGIILLLSSWDGLYDRLELPQATPALSAQLGGLTFLALAYFFWAARGRPALESVAAGAGVIAYGGGAVLIAAWLIFRDRADLAVDKAGIVVLIVVAAVLAVLALALVRAALGQRDSAE